MVDMTCKRCTIGVDNDGDGDCALCVGVSTDRIGMFRILLAAKMKDLMLSARNEAFNEVDAVLRSMRVSENPVLKVSAHRQRYPGVFDFFNARVSESQWMKDVGDNSVPVPIFTGHVSPLYLTRRGNPTPHSSCMHDNFGDAADEEIKRREQQYQGPVLEALKHHGQ